MRDRREQFLKLSCLALGALLAFQLARFIIAGDPAKGLVIPALPSLPPEPDAQNVKGTNSVTAKGAGKTNAPAVEAVVKTGTNSTGSGGQTNSNVKIEGEKNGVEVGLKTPNSNSIAARGASQTLTTSAVIKAALIVATNDTNALPESSTNRQSNSLPSIALGRKGTNVLSSAGGAKSGTNSDVLRASSRTNSAPPGRMAMGGKPVELPAEIKERVDRITQGEILGQVIRPMPMALLGIAGPHAFLRSADGQTGMIKEGEKLGSLKLIRIGNNRVLIEEEGEKKELSIFAGLGSETLMPAKEPPAKEKKPNEPTTKSP